MLDGEIAVVSFDSFFDDVVAVVINVITKVHRVIVQPADIVLDLDDDILMISFRCFVFCDCLIRGFSIQILEQCRIDRVPVIATVVDQATDIGVDLDGRVDRFE